MIEAVGAASLIGAAKAVTCVIRLERCTAAKFRVGCAGLAGAAAALLREILRRAQADLLSFGGPARSDLHGRWASSHTFMSSRSRHQQAESRKGGGHSSGRPQAHRSQPRATGLAAQC